MVFQELFSGISAASSRKQNLQITLSYQCNSSRGTKETARTKFSLTELPESMSCRSGGRAVSSIWGHPKICWRFMVLRSPRRLPQNVASASSCQGMSIQQENELLLRKQVSEQSWKPSHHKMRRSTELISTLNWRQSGHDSFHLFTVVRVTCAVWLKLISVENAPF